MLLGQAGTLAGSAWARAQAPRLSLRLAAGRLGVSAKSPGVKVTVTVTVAVPAASLRGLLGYRDLTGSVTLAVLLSEHTDIQPEAGEHGSSPARGSGRRKSQAASGPGAGGRSGPALTVRRPVAGPGPAPVPGRPLLAAWAPRAALRHSASGTGGAGWHRYWHANAARAAQRPARDAGPTRARVTL